MTPGFVEPRREDHGHGHGHAGLRPVRARPQARRQRSYQNQASYCLLTYINVYAEVSEALDMRIKIKLKFYGVSDYNRAFRSNARGVSRGMSSRRGQILLH